jgi:cbb3-type cytochrome oxidase subunit 3
MSSREIWAYAIIALLLLAPVWLLLRARRRSRARREHRSARINLFGAKKAREGGAD